MQILTYILGHLELTSITEQTTMTETFTVTISTVNITDNVTSQAQGPPHYVDELKLANKVILSTILAFIMVAMGCVISIKDIKTTVSLYLNFSR